jgi:hypothetical protein
VLILSDERKFALVLIVIPPCPNVGNVSGARGVTGPVAVAGLLSRGEIEGNGFLLGVVVAQFEAGFDSRNVFCTLHNVVSSNCGIGPHQDRLKIRNA